MNLIKMKKLGRPSIEDKAIRTQFRLYDVDKENLNKITLATGENKSEIIRRLITKESKKIK